MLTRIRHEFAGTVDSVDRPWPWFPMTTVTAGMGR